MNISSQLSKIRQTKPLILNVTNFVAMEFSANALLALGGSPIMSMDPEEMEELVRASSAVVINMGTLHPTWMMAAERAWACAKEMKKPVVFDPVGSGATKLRTNFARNYLKHYGADIVRGNSSEILSLYSEEQTGKGVDAGIDSSEVARRVHSSIQDGTTCVVSGATDYILSSQKMLSVRNGSPEMTRVTAMGCVSTALIAAFRAVEEDPQASAFAAMAVMGICGELAAQNASGPGTLRAHFLDNLAEENIPYEELLK